MPGELAQEIPSEAAAAEHAGLNRGSAFHGTVERAVVEGRLAPLWPEVWAAKMEADGANVEWGADTPSSTSTTGCGW